MSIFQCSKCGCAENTALTFGYLARVINPPKLVALGLDPQGRYCSACYEGEWHGKFPQRFYPVGSMETNAVGNLVPKTG